jgi:lipoyl(octanoyl) transferase
MTDVYKNLQSNIPSFLIEGTFEFYENLIFYTHFNWEYEKYLHFLSCAHKFILENPKFKIFLICSHPHVLTMGSGNQKNYDEKLNEFDEKVYDYKYPLYNIKRGGGLTFHHPGQIIIYPIIYLTPRFSLQDLSHYLLKIISEILNKYYPQVDKFITANKLLGVWYQKKKIASIGIGVERYVSLHGLALNVLSDLEFSKYLSRLNPCGLNFEIYTNLQKILEQQESVENVQIQDDLLSSLQSKLVSWIKADYLDKKLLN